MSAHLKAFEIVAPAYVAMRTPPTVELRKARKERALTIRDAANGPTVKWSSRGSGVVYTPHKPSRRVYLGLQLNRVARELVAPPLAGIGAAAPSQGVAVDLSRLSKRARKERARLLAK